MKKILALITTATILTLNLSAYELPDKHIGINLVSIGDSSGKGLTFGIEKMWKISYLGVESNDKYINSITVGGGIDLDYTSITSSPINDFVYGGDMQILFGYDFKKSFNQPFEVKVGFGYDATIISSNSHFKGMIFTTSTTYNFTDKFGIELAYKRGELELSNNSINGIKSTKSSFGFNLVWR